MKNTIFGTDFCVLDTETTGLSPKTGDKLVEIAIYKIKINEMNYTIEDKFITLLNPERMIPYYVSKIHGIYDHMVEKSPNFHEISEKMTNFLSNIPLVIQNAPFDLSFLNNELNLCRRNEITNPIIDTIYISRQYYGNGVKHNLDAICKRLNIIKKVSRHRAEGDVILTTEAFFRLRKLLLIKYNS
jgi:DNA polymerase III epsilon subunit